MPDVMPGDASYEDTLRRIAELIKADERERGKIEHLSTESFREWLSGAVDRIATELGIAASYVTALIVDVFTIGVNAATSFKNAYRSNFDKARKIQRSR